MVDLSGFYGQTIIDSTEKYCTAALKMLNELTEKKASVRSIQMVRSIALNNLGISADERHDPVKAMNYYSQAMEVQKKIDDQIGIAASFNNMGSIFLYQGNIAKALECFSAALKIAERSKDKKKSGAAEYLNNIGLIYDQQLDHQTALNYYLRSLQLEIEKGNKDGIASSLNTIGSTYYYLKDLKKALENVKRSLAISRELKDDIGIANALNNLSSIYTAMKDSRKAIESLMESKEVLERNGYQTGLVTVLHNLGEIYLTNGQFSEAKDMLDRSLAMAKEIGSANNLKLNALSLSVYYEKKGDNEKALEMYKLYIQMRDSLSNESTRKASIKQQLKYEYEKQTTADSIAHAKESEIKDVELRQQSAEIKVKKNQQYALFGGLFLVCLFGVFIYNRFKVTQKQKIVIEKQKQLVEEQKLMVEVKQKEVLDSIRYAKRIQKAHLPSEAYIFRAIKKFRS